MAAAVAPRQAALLQQSKTLALTLLTLTTVKWPGVLVLLLRVVVPVLLQLFSSLMTVVVPLKTLGMATTGSQGMHALCHVHALGHHLGLLG